MARGDSKIQPRRSSRLRKLSLPKNTSKEPIDIPTDQETEEEEESQIQSQSEDTMYEQEQSPERLHSSDDNFQESTRKKKAPTIFRKLTNPEEVQKIQNQTSIRFKLNSRRKHNVSPGQEEQHEDQVVPSDEDQDAEKVINRKWKRKSQQENNEEQRKSKKHKYATKMNPMMLKQQIKAAEHINKKKEQVKMRTSPRWLSELLYYLTDEQREWVKEAGFESILEFDLELLPGKLAYNVMQIFNQHNVSLQLKNAQICINEEDVFDVLGLPHGGEKVRIGDPETYKDRINKWLTQFPTEREDQITAAMIVQKTKEAGVTDNFKLNFLIIMSNILIGSTTSSYMDVRLLRFGDDLDRCCHYNWAEYLIKNLVDATDSWNRTSSLFFKGALIFLTLLYVDRVRYKGEKLVERRFPSYKGWTEEKLKQRQAMEIFEGVFGVGVILPPLRDVFSQDTQPITSPSPKKHDHYVKDSHHNDEDKNLEEQFKELPASNYDKDYQGWDAWKTTETNASQNEKDSDDPWNAWTNDEVYQTWDDWSNEKIDTKIQKDTKAAKKEKKTEEEFMDNLRERASALLDAKIQFDIKFNIAKMKYPNNQDLRLIEDIFHEIFPTSKGKESNEDENRTSEKEKPEEESMMEHEKTPPKETDTLTSEEVYDFDLRPEDIEHLDLEAYLYFKKKEESLYVPSFSLGIDIDPIDQVCNEIQKEYGSPQDKNKEANDPFLTPKPVTRERRQTKVGPYSRSPFIERAIDVNARFTVQDIALWRYMIQKKNELEEVFVWKGISCIREHIQTLKVGNLIYYSVIDTWATILNDNENYKSDESPMRLFCPVGSVVWSLDVKKSVTVTYPNFSQNMNEMLIKFPNRDLSNVDMVLFPINAYEHYYLVVYNLKNPGYEIIDNVKREEEDNPKIYYGKVPVILHSHFVKYLKEKDLVNLGKTIQKLKPSYLKMNWQTKGNSRDCGIFLMRHMETYKGDIKNWETAFKNEGPAQEKQIVRLRVKYNNAILSSHLNEKRDQIQKEAKELYNSDAEQQLFSLVREASAKRLANIQKGNSNEKQPLSNRKTVTFAEHLTTTIDSAGEDH